MVTPQPRRKEAKNEPSRAPTRTTGSTGKMSTIKSQIGKWIRTERIVDTEVETTVNDDTDDGRNEATVETSNTVRGKGLLVDVDETVELASSSALGRLRVVGETRTSVVKRVHEEQGCSTSSATGGDITSEPLPITVRLLEAEKSLEVILCMTRQNRF